MSLPNVSQQQIDAMNKLASENMAKNGIVQEEVQQEGVLHPMLANHIALPNHEEPVIEEVEYEDQEVEEPIEVVEEDKKPISLKDQNLRNLRKQAERAEYDRERAERAERERDEAVKYAMSLQGNKQSQAPQQEVEDDFPDIAIDDESLLEGKHIKPLVKEIKNLRSLLKSYEQKSKQNDIQTLEMRLQAQYPDFNKVVTQENLVQLREINPDLAEAIVSNKDQYKQAKLAYEMVKQMGIYQENAYNNDKVIAQKNATKPRPLSSIAPTQNNSPISKVNAFANSPLTKEIKDQHYQEMLQAMKGL